MKRKCFLGSVILVLLIAFLVSCGNTPKTLVECGEEVIALMTEMVENEDYKSLYNLPAAYDEKIDVLRRGDYSKSSAVYEVLVPMEALLDSDVNKNDFSEELYQYICSSAYISFASRVNQVGGVENMAISSVFTAQKCFTNENMNENKIYLYVFEDGVSVAISFVADGEDSCRAVGHFILNDTFVTDDEQSIKESCEALGIIGVTVKKQ